MELNLFVKELFSKAQEEGFSEYEVYYVDRESLSISVYKEEVCPARWKPGAKTLKPSIELVGNI